jgi:hypothetical protein
VKQLLAPVPFILQPSETSRRKHSKSRGRGKAEQTLLLFELLEGTFG